MKKYELTENKKEYMGYILYQIKAIKSFSDVKKGDFGGWIEKESNLSQAGNSWVYDDARIFGNAEISGNAKIFGNAEISGNVWISGNAEISVNKIKTNKTKEEEIRDRLRSRP